MLLNKNGFTDLDTRNYPIVDCKPANFTPTARHLENYFEDVRKIFRHFEGPSVFVVPLPNQFLSMTTIRKCAVFAMGLEKEFPGRFLGFSTVATSALTRQLIKMFNSVSGSSVKMWVSSTHEEAWHKAEEILEQVQEAK